MVMQNEMETGAVKVTACLNDGRLENVIQEQRVVALQVSFMSAHLRSASQADNERKSARNPSMIFYSPKRL